MISISIDAGIAFDGASVYRRFFFLKKTFTCFQIYLLMYWLSL